MIPPKARPSLLHLAMIELLDTWSEELETLGLSGHPQFDTATRYKPLVFLACDRLRREGGEPRVPMDVRFTDWLAAPALEFFQSGALDRNRTWIVDRGFIAWRRPALNFTVTSEGRSAVHMARDLSSAAFAESDYELRADLEEAIAATVHEIAPLRTEDLRDYLLSYSFKLYNEGVGHSWIDFDTRYRAADTYDRKERLGGRTDTYKLY